MESSANSVHPLSALPAEILDLILSHDDLSHLVVRLWKAGDKRLNAKLSAGITMVGLYRAEGYDFPLPAVLSQLRGLTHLSLKSKGSFVLQSHHWLSLVLKLPKTLTWLEIVTDDSNVAFINHATGIGPVPFKRGDSPCIDIGATLPRLKTLKLRTTSPNLFPALPSTLTALHSNLSDYEDLSMATLPRSLQILESELWVGIDSEEPTEDQIAEDWYPELEHFACAPPDLDHISHIDVDIFSGRQTWGAQLPKGLRTLNFCQDVDVTPLLVSLLPRSLTAIKMMNVQYLELRPFLDENAPSSIWPPSLLTLELIIYDYKPAYIAALPRSLTELHVSFPEHDSSSSLFASELPPQLRSLTIASADGYLGIEEPLPRTLTQLSLLGPCTALKRWSDLPPSITSLELKLDGSPNWADSILSLTTLILDYCQPEYFKLIPRTVTRLEINVLGLGQLDPSLPAASLRSLLDLPLSLVSFTLKRYKGDDFTEMPLSAFNQLEELRLPGTMYFETSVFASLPRSLRILEMEIRGGDAKDFLHLPPRLSFCNLGRKATNLPQIEEYWPVYELKQLVRFPEKAKRVKQRWRALDH